MPFLLLLAATEDRRRARAVGAAQWRAPVAYPHVFPPWFHLLFLAAFAGTGAALLWVARTDRRARAFGVVLVSFGTVFADPLLRHALLTAAACRPASASCSYATQVVAFTPAALWLFRQRLSRARATPDRLARSPRPRQARRGVGRRRVAREPGRCDRGPPVPWTAAGLAARRRRRRAVSLLSVLDLPAFPFLLIKGRRARAARAAPRVPVPGRARGGDAAAGDRRAAQRRGARVPGRRRAAPARAVGTIVSAALLLVPLLTAYAVAGRLFDVRFMVRRVVQYALARYTVIAALSVPAVALALAIYQRRDERLGDVLTLRSPLVWLLLTALATDAVGPPYAARDDRPPILPRALRRAPHPADAGLRQRPRAQPAGAGDAGVGRSRSRAAPAPRGAEHPGPGRRGAARSAAAAAAAVDRQPAGGAAGRLGGATRRRARARLAIRARAPALGRSPVARGDPRAAAGAAPRAHRVAAGRDDAGTQAQRAAIQRRRPAAADGRRRIGGAGDRPAAARRIRRGRDGGQRPPTTSRRRRSASAAAASTRAARRNAVAAAATCAIRCCRHTWRASSPSIAASAPAAWASSTRATTSRSIAW